MTKTGVTRNFTLPPAACQWLQEWREAVSSHSFRSPVLTTAHKVGLGLRVEAEISGQSSLEALERYFHVSAARETAEAVRGLLVG